MENVLEHKELQGKRVIELGSGVGFSGIVSSILGNCVYLVLSLLYST